MFPVFAGNLLKKSSENPEKHRLRGWNGCAQGNNYCNGPRHPTRHSPDQARRGAGPRADRDPLRSLAATGRRACARRARRALPAARAEARASLQRRAGAVRRPPPGRSLGLVKAVDRFELGRGTAFSSFAVPTILGELKRYFRDLGWAVHVPRAAQERAVKVEDAQQTLSLQSGRTPTVPELAQYVELDVEDVLDALETARAHHASSLDAPYDDDEGDGGTVVDAFGGEDPDLRLVVDRVTVGEAARHLSSRERKVLGLRFVQDLTQTQIAEQIGVSQMQVSRILRRAIASLSRFTEADSSSH
ncbi:MAG: sigma-70 family RNA polymerase sigma factor [Solirubrobacteraceae bacterium]